MATLDPWVEAGPLNHKVSYVNQDITDETLIIPFDWGFIGEVTCYPETSFSIYYTTDSDPLTTPNWILLEEDVTEAKTYPLAIYASGLKVVAVGILKVTATQIKGFGI
jgi:hypothetical protein